MGSTGKNESPPPGECPICGNPVERPRRDAVESTAYPFCSERCRLVDLSRWLDEDYRIPDKPNDV
jgi:uncharacterized protein